MFSRGFEDKRPDFLIKMYEVYNNEIDRHFGFAWQAVSVFAASIVTILTSTETIAGIPSYAALSLYIVLVTWGIETIIDSYFWYNRNLVVIANIERQFLQDKDAKEIHYYFQSHRKSNKPITFFNNLLLFLIATPLLVIAFYFWIPATAGRYYFYHDISTYIPLVILVIAILQIRASTQKRNAHYREFMTQSPGIDRGLAPKTAEHAFEEPLGLSRISRWVSNVQNAVLSALGVEVR